MLVPLDFFPPCFRSPERMSTCFFWCALGHFLYCIPVLIRIESYAYSKHLSTTRVFEFSACIIIVFSTHPGIDRIANFKHKNKNKNRN